MSPRIAMRLVRRLSAFSLLFGAGLCQTAVAQITPEASPPVARMIVKLRDSGAAVRGAAAIDDAVRSLSARSRIGLTKMRRMSGGAQVLNLPRSMSVAEAQATAEQLMQDPNVEFAEPDRWVEPLLIPNDVRYPYQWYLHDAQSQAAAASLPQAWDLTRGLSSVVVAVIDSGIVAHAELDPARVLSGYDFISDVFVANDGGGRDDDARDPGNWITESDVSMYPTKCGPTKRNSTWHGLHVAGIIGATGDNGQGIAGANWHSKLLPVRVLGKCGGYLSDVLDGVRWAAGVADPNLPANPHPARVINLSLGSVAACGASTQSAISDAIEAGAVVITAAGNKDGASEEDASAVTPGNCAGVVNVGAVDSYGDRAWYSRIGSNVSLSAPGIAESLFNTGTREPLADSYAYLHGTSMAAAQVSGVASLMLSLNPALTADQVRRKLSAAARPFPAGSTCNQSTCGVGLLDAGRAVQSAMANGGGDQQVQPSAVVTLNAAGSVAAAPAAIAGYAWVQTSGAQVALSDPLAERPTFMAPDAPQTLVFELAVTDDSRVTGTDTVRVEVVANASFSSSGATAGTGGGGGGCFIATAAYGTADATDVRTLRQFRDRHLLTHPVGRALVATYYKLSPPLADAIRPHPFLRKLIRIGLIPYVAVARWLRPHETAG